MTPERVLARLARADAVLAREKDGARYGLYPSGDRRRRPLARLPAATVKNLLADGALDALDGERCVLSPAGRARVERASAAPDEAWRAQHEPIVDRAAVDRDGDLYTLRGLDAGGAAARLARLKDSAGKPFFAANEIAAAARLAQDFAMGQEGLIRGVDWAAPPRGSSARGAGVQAAKASAIDARARVDAALTALAPAAAALVKAACLEQVGLAALETRAGWPARSAKIALKFALAQLAQIYRGAPRD